MPNIPVHTKSDLRGSADIASTLPSEADQMEEPGHLQRVVAVSATTRAGLSELLEEIHRVLDHSVGTVQPDLPVLTRARHRHALQNARNEMAQFCTVWAGGETPPVVAAIHVRSACHSLDELIGSIDVDDVLEQVFQTFCVGK